MPAITSGKVLVSGANGYIAVWVVRKLLEAGFSVRGAVRATDKGAHLVELFTEYGDKFEVVVVPDITKEGAFDEAVKGVDAIEHTASPFHFEADDPAELVAPAVQGTLGILRSALKNGTTVKRVVVTSSCAAVLNVSDKPQILNETNWNDQAVEEVEKMGKAASQRAKYRTSKTLAERSAWKFVEEHKSEIGWDLVCLNPPLVLGPMIHAVSSPSELNTSARDLYDAFFTPGKAGGGGCWVDVRDLADAHVKALRREQAGGERVILTAGPFSWQDWLDSVPTSDKFQNGTPGAGKDFVHLLRYDTRKSVELLGMEYRPMKNTAEDVVKDWEARGWC